MLAKNGFQVHLYEMRDDIRQMEVVKGKSINMALSERGRSALRELNLEDVVVKCHGVPMYGRQIHDRNGKKRFIPYGKNNQCIYSVGRRHLNEVLLTAAEEYSNLTIHFNHKLVACKFDERKLTFTSNGNLISTTADVIIGADGAHSCIRREMIKQTLIDFSQTYIEHGYLELSIPATVDDNFAMEVNRLHIWPRGSLMMIALPNEDKTYTVTLFMPFEKFNSLKTEDALIRFFEENFKDAIPLIGREQLIQDFFKTKPSSLISIKCKPYNFGHTALLLGDAAHAMVPFYGQGMNSGFEDCVILNEILKTNGNNLQEALPTFSRIRNQDGHTICDLAMYNYIEMRDLVNSSTFLLRKKFDGIMHSIFGSKWIPLYSMVSFTRIPYTRCVQKRKFQDKIINLAFGSFVTAAIIGFSSFLILKLKIKSKFSISFER